MSSWKLVKLNFGHSPAHFGELGIGIEETSERVRSDSLFSAWVSIYARLLGQEAVESLLQRFHQSPPVRISSTFIYREEAEHTIYYLPRPLKFPINYPKDDLEFFKTYKKLNFLPLEVWQRWYQTEGFAESDARELIAETTGKSQGLLRKAGAFDYKNTFKIGQLPKIAVDRITRATNLYHTGFVQFETEKNRSGLYFLLYFPNSEQQLEHNLRAALNLLGEEGLGGERSSGAGRFEVEWLELPLIWQKVVNFSEQPVYHCLISLFWDDDASNLKQLITNESSYDIQERGGWIASSERQLRRQFVRMFAEGSVFPTNPQGKLADVTPKGFTIHRVYRSGIGLSLPIKVNEPPRRQERQG
ncbi:type III-A CRISPR-associated RAMP protein Csm4 [Iningainema tapete]|uniref:CRISPR system Cms protein Csm4 n=1 Tax=Iningainema tapete BLCC-T55 TaxID=2748662 RepID=A0A8J7CHP6_9CYAN|nr:type III-A CRISPR-associated RAMP protein Csm4 [Iningainema tapete]MBD2777900.1 type III-A CRISPR-associated RAMP protein Csm4 [Iningainema tapete BLCC-T55]